MPSNRNFPLKLAFIGGSAQSAVGYAHYVSCRMDNLWTVEAGCFSSDKGRNEETAKRYAVAADRTYRDWRALLKGEKNRVDAVVLLTPTPDHAEMAVECLKQGFAVICEKALAASSEEIERIREARDRAKGFLAVTYNYSGYPMVREMRGLIEDGAIGTLTHFQVEMPQDGFQRTDAQGKAPSPQAWRLKDGNVPTIHLDLAVHLHQLLFYLLGRKPVEVISSQGTFGRLSGVIDNVNCLCRFEGGVEGGVWFSKSALGNRNGLRLRIFGTAGSLEWAQAEPERLRYSRSDGGVEILERGAKLLVANLPRYNRFKAGHPAGFLEAFANLYADLFEALHQFKANGSWKPGEVFGAELALEGLQWLEAMSESAADGQWHKVGGDRRAPRLVRRAGGAKS